jgi:hypothetical protein
MCICYRDIFIIFFRSLKFYHKLINSQIVRQISLLQKAYFRLEDQIFKTLVNCWKYFACWAYFVVLAPPFWIIVCPGFRCLKFCLQYQIQLIHEFVFDELHRITHMYWKRINDILSHCPLSKWNFRFTSIKMNIIGRANCLFIYFPM